MFKKRIICMCSVLVLCLSFMQEITFASSGITFGQTEIFNYIIQNGEICIMSCTAKTEPNIVIPSEIEGYPVTSIYQNIFHWNNYITSVTLPHTLKEIGVKAFYECYNLERVYITDLSAFCKIDFLGDDLATSNHANPLYNGADLYLNGQKLTNLVIPSDVTYLSDDLFARCSSIESVTVLQNVKEIGGSVFYDCPNLKTATISADTKVLGEFTFALSASLENVSISSNFETIGQGAFLGCSALKTIDLTGNVTEIGGRVFEGCSALESVSFSKTVKTIGFAAFSGCQSLKAITIPDSVQTIGDTAFRNCTALTQITIPEGVTKIGSDTFYYCTNLECVELPSTIEEIGANAFERCFKLNQITLPQGVTKIGGNAFEDCKELESINIPNGVTAIEKNTFASSGLKKITLPSNLESVGEYAFYGTDVEDLVIPDSVRTIGESAFEKCFYLNSVVMPKNLEAVGADAFDYCDNLKKVDITDLKKWCGVVFSNKYANPFCNKSDMYNNGVLVTDLVIPEGVTTISSKAFWNCQSIKSVKFPKSLISVGEYAFNYCYYLESVDFEQGVTSIGESAFESCYYLGYVTLPDTVTTIGKDAFAAGVYLKKFTFPKNITQLSERVLDLSDIKMVYIPKGVTEVSTGAFFRTELKYVYYEGSAEDRKNIVVQADNEQFENAIWYYNQTGLPECQFDNVCDTECNVCGTYRRVSHEFGEYFSDNNATLEKDGTKTRFCNLCEHKETVTDVGSKITLKDTSEIFDDVPKNKWFKSQVDYVYAYGIFTGTTATAFSPNSNITRAQFVQVLANLSGVDTSNRKLTTKFSDVPSGKWYTAAVKWASENAIVNGVGGGKFAPDANITREQMCVMLVNYAKFREITLYYLEPWSEFADTQSISQWAILEVHACQMADLVNGKGGNKFDPKASATRAEAATIFSKFHKDYLVN